MENQTLSLERDLETTTSVLDLQDGPDDPRRPLLRRDGDHRSRAPRARRRARIHNRLRARSRRVREHADSQPAPGRPGVPSLPPMDLLLFPDRENFGESFGADLSAADAAFMADSQVPCGVEALNGAVRVRAWRSKPDQGPALELPPNGETSRSQPVSGIPSGAWRAGVTCASTTRVRAMQASQPGT